MNKNHKVACMSIGGHAQGFQPGKLGHPMIFDLCGTPQCKDTVEQQAYSLPTPSSHQLILAQASANRRLCARQSGSKQM